MPPLASRSLVIAALLIGTTTSTATAGSDPANAQDSPSMGTVPGQLIVGLESSSARHRVAQSLTDRGYAILEECEDLGLLLVALPATRSLVEGEGELGNLTGVSLVERNHRGQGGGNPPDDSYFSSQWHHQNTGQGGGTAGVDLESVPAWNIETGSAQVVVAVLDTGIDFQHPEFVGRLLPGWDFVNEDGDPTADHNHGIWVTGLLAANADNTFQVAGMDQACQILPIKVLNRFNAGTNFDLIQGLEYAANEKADILNLSLINYTDTSALRQGLQYATNAGCILVCSSGNGGIGDADQSWPGASALTISVGATDDQDRRAAFSGTGAALDFVAPGELVATASPLRSQDVFNWFSGTSASAPLTAGVISLLLAQNPALDQQGAYALLRGGVEDQVGRLNEDKPGWDSYHGHGRVNAVRSLLSLGITILNLQPSPGEALTVDLVGGLPGATAWVVAVDVNTTSGFWVLDRGAFDGNGQRLLTWIVPTGLSGLDVGMVGLGVQRLGGVAISHVETVQFQ